MDKQGIVNYVMNNLPNVNKTVLKSLLVALDEGEVLNINKILDYVGYTGYNTNRAVLNTLLMSEEVPLVGHAYAKYNTKENIFYFFRDDEEKYEEEQVIGDEIFFTDVENYEAYPNWTFSPASICNNCQKIIFNDVIQPINCKGFFEGFSKVTEIQNIEKLDTSQTITMESMFRDFDFLFEVDLSHFNTSNVTDLHSMFMGTTVDTSTIKLNLNNFDTSKVTIMTQMFYESSIKTIIVGSDFVTSQVTNSDFMFEKATNLVGGAGTTYNNSHIDKEYARIDNPPDEPGYFTAK